MCELTAPADKHDLPAAEAIVSLGLQPCVVSRLPEILEWFGDFNWPVAKALVPLFQNSGIEVVPAMEGVLNGSDNVHKYWVLQILVPIVSAEAQSKLLPIIKRIARSPTPGEVAEEVELEAREFLAGYAGT